MGSYGKKHQPVIFSNPSDDYPLEYRDDFIDGASAHSAEDPHWIDKVTESGQLFYIETTDPVEYVTPQLHPTNSPTPTHFQNGHGTKSPKKKARLKKLIGSNDKSDVTLTDHVLSRHNIHSNGLGVTFNDIPTGVMKDVTIFVDPFKNNYGRRTTKCEAYFGIIPGYFGSPSQDSDGSGYLPDKRIMVQGLLPGEPAIKAGVKIGEWLMCVNDLEVTYDNLDSILMGITGPRFIKLTLQKIAIQTSPKQVLVKKKSVISDEVMKMVSGERLEPQGAEQQVLQELPHTAMYLTLECSSETMADKDDILYQFPHQESKLHMIRGLFITLSDMMHDVTNNTAKNSTVVIDGKVVHAAYCKENREVFVICLPAEKVSIAIINQLMDNVVRLLKILYGSVKNAFNQPKNHSQLDHFFTLLFQKLLLAEQFYENVGSTQILLEPFCDILPAVRSIVLPEETKLTVDNCLSELEAGDFADMSEAYYDLRRMYTIMGSCMFYKGYLLSSHLHREDLLDMTLYLRYHCLLTLCSEAQLGQLLLWREVFPTRRCHRHVDPIIPGYTEPKARFFLLIVGRKNMLLGVLLEAGGCASQAEGSPPPDPFYVDQAKATLLQMESLDLITQCENRLQSYPVPGLSSADEFMPAQKSSKNSTAMCSTDPGLTPSKSSPKTASHLATDQSIRSLNTHHSPISQQRISRGTPSKEPESILKKRSTPVVLDDGRPKGRGAVYDGESEDVESHSTGTSEERASGTLVSGIPLLNRLWSSSQASEDSSGSSSAALFKGSKRRRNMLSVYDMTAIRKGLEGEGSPGSFVKLTSGCENTLFHYVHMDTLDGILLCPCQQDLPLTGSGLHQQVLYNFQHACIAIRRVFQQSRRATEASKEGQGRKFKIDDSLGHVTEHGVLFQCSSSSHSESSKKAPPVMNYWVIGRVLTDPVEREFYVCFHDSAQQNSIEMAFKLGFGMAF